MVQIRVGNQAHKVEALPKLISLILDSDLVQPIQESLFLFE